MAGYTKLFSSILASTIWREDNDTRIVWITMLAMSDRDGIVEASVPGLADIARVSVDGCRRAILKLSSPDADSRTDDMEGRRIEAVEGGWRLVNHAKYRAKMSEEERREYKRRKAEEYRKRVHGADTSRQVWTSVDSGVLSGHIQSQSTEAEAEVQLAPLAVAPNPKPTKTKPLAYRPRIDVAWPGRPPVPSQLHAEFRSKLGGDPETADARLNAWYPIAAASFEDQPIGDDDFKFWRLRFREWVGTTAKSLEALEPELNTERMLANLRKRGVKL